LRDISAHIKETYDTDISATTLSCLASFHDPGHTPHDKKPPNPKALRYCQKQSGFDFSICNSHAKDEVCICCHYACNVRVVSACAATGVYQPAAFWCGGGIAAELYQRHHT